VVPPPVIQRLFSPFTLPTPLFGPYIPPFLSPVFVLPFFFPPPPKDSWCRQTFFRPPGGRSGWKTHAFSFWRRFNLHLNFFMVVSSRLKLICTSPISISQTDSTLSMRGLPFAGNSSLFTHFGQQLFSVIFFGNTSPTSYFLVIVITRVSLCL